VRLSIFVTLPPSPSRFKLLFEYVVVIEFAAYADIGDGKLG
jgi:hypothetical protein